MNKKLQQQIIGAIFIVALLLLFVPYFLSPKDDNPTLTPTNVPTGTSGEKPAFVSTDPNASNEADNQNLQPDPIPESAWNQATQTATPEADSSLMVPGGDIGPAPVVAATNVDNTQVESIATTILQNNAVQTPPVLNTNQTPPTTVSTVPPTTVSTVPPTTASTVPPTTASTTPPTTQTTPPKSSATLEFPELKLVGTSITPPIRPTTPQVSPQKTTNTQQVVTNFRWFVQVGGFSQEAKATALMKQYQAVGYPVYIDHSANIHKVRLGPFKTKQNAQRVQGNLKQEGISTMIVQLP